MAPGIAIEPALKAAGLIGVWSTNVPAALSVLDEGAASILAGDASLANLPLSLETALKQTHPTDQGWVFERIRRVRQTGGSFSAEFRVVTTSGEVRWVLNRGILAPDDTGTMRGCGVYIDTTDSHTAPAIPGDLIEIPESDPVIAAADYSLEAHTAIVRTGHQRLRRLSERLLTEIGFVLARRQRAN